MAIGLFLLCAAGATGRSLASHFGLPSPWWWAVGAAALALFLLVWLAWPRRK
jgi:hypothetical protein